MSAAFVHLVRHGEVDNPHQVVYADLPGYGLSGRGIAQAAATAEHLAARPVAKVVSSPLLRAAVTAETIAAVHGLAVELDPALTEWAVSQRWAGVRWDDLDRVFPGELEAYLTHPLHLGFGTESLQECGARVAAAVRKAAEDLAAGELVVVSHQDPIHAGHLNLVAATPSDYHADKPAHAGVLTLQPTANGWIHNGYWEPHQGAVFPPLP